MNVERAKEVIRNDTPTGNVFERLEAIKVALSVLGESATMKEIWRWAERGDKQNEEVIE